MPRILRFRLSLLMFLQYYMMGAWFVPFGTYMSRGLQFGSIIGFAYASQGIATILSTFLVGTLADRIVPAQRLLAALFLLASATLLLLAYETRSVELFLLITFLHFLFFIPTIPLANSICFHWLPNPDDDFPRVRVLGTVGWIVSGLTVGAIAGSAESRIPLLIGAAVGLLLASYSLTLPNTPPGATGSTHEAARFPDLLKLAHSSFWVLIIATLMIMLPMSFYYAYCNTFLSEAGIGINLFGKRFEATAVQSLGQVSELLFLLLLPASLKLFGIRGIFLLGIASWVARYALFAIGFDGTTSVQWALLAGILLHGAANDFIQVAGQIYVNQSFSRRARARAQALFTTSLMGFGAVIGSAIANATYNALSASTGQHDWHTIWLIPAGAALVTFVFFAVFFRAAAVQITPQK